MRLETYLDAMLRAYGFCIVMRTYKPDREMNINKMMDMRRTLIDSPEYKRKSRQYKKFRDRVQQLFYELLARVEDDEEWVKYYHKILEVTDNDADLLHVGPPGRVMDGK